MTALLVLAGLFAVGGDVEARVQEAAARLAASTEAVVVLDVSTGRVLAHAGDIERPMPPGSTFKIVDVLAAARAHSPALDRKVRCEGHAVIGGAKVYCPRGEPHGELDLDRGMATSCNIYFGTMGHALGTQKLIDEARALGVGAHPGLLPGRGAAPARVADGVGVRQTPLQYARLLRQVARGVRDDGQPITDAANLARLRHALRAVVEGGTGVAANTTTVPVAGKTGTAPFEGRELGWFGGYAPAEAPQVIVVVARRGVTGKEVAGMTPPIFDAYFKAARATP